MGNSTDASAAGPISTRLPSVSGRAEPLGYAVAACVLAGLAALMTLVARSSWREVESQLSEAVHESIPDRLDSALEFVSLNDRYVYVVGALVWIVIALRRRQGLVVMVVLGASGSGAATLALTRAVLDSTRPSQYDPLGMGPSWQFPSGHAFASTLIATLVTGLIFIARSETSRSWIATAWIWAGGVALLKFVGGNHYLGDIVVGGLMGAAWACVALVVFLAWPLSGADRLASNKPQVPGFASHSNPDERLDPARSVKPDG